MPNSLTQDKHQRKNLQRLLHHQRNQRTIKAPLSRQILQKLVSKIPKLSPLNSQLLRSQRKQKPQAISQINQQQRQSNRRSRQRVSLRLVTMQMQTRRQLSQPRTTSKRESLLTRRKANDCFACNHQSFGLILFLQFRMRPNVSSPRVGQSHLRLKSEISAILAATSSGLIFSGSKKLPYIN